MTPKQKQALLAGIVMIVLIGLIWFSFRQNVDLLVVNAVIHTMDDRNSTASAMAVKDGKVVAVGSASWIRLIHSAPEILDVKGKAVFPGFIDGHGHFLSLGLARMTVDLVGARSIPEVARRVRERVETVQPGRWVRGRGWDQNLWTSKAFPTHRALTELSDVHPIVLSRVDGHAIWVNQLAMEIAGVTAGTRDPEGGKIVRDGAGRPTGVFIDNARVLITRHMPSLTEEEVDEAAMKASSECLRVGLTGVHDMGVDLQEIDLYKNLVDEDRLHVRLYAAIEGAGETWEAMKATGPLLAYGNGHLTVRALKMYIDGALGSRGAALIEPYTDDPGNRGLTVTSESELRLLVDEALEAGFQVCTHAIGDRGNAIVLDVYESALSAGTFNDPRLRIEHVQVLHPDDIGRFAKSGIIPSMQPTHGTSDMYWAEARLGPERVRGAYAWRSLLNSGVWICGGSDFPVERPDPLAGIYAAVTRRDADGIPRTAADVAQRFQLSARGIVDSAAFDGGWYFGERMTRNEAVRAFTVWPARAAFQEDVVGSLEAGKLADFVILSADILAIPDHELLSTLVERTYVGGRLRYQAEE